MILWAVTDPNGYEISSLGDRRFSALFARLSDGRTIEQAYQLDIKGYRRISNDWRIGKGRKPIDPGTDLWAGYLGLWKQWAIESPRLISELYRLSKGKVLTDGFARTPINQARALAHILEEYEQL